MKLYNDHFYCFGYTEYGDVVKLTARLFGLTQYEAAKKVCSDFGIIHLGDKPIVRQKIVVEGQREKEQRVFHILSDYCSLLRRFRSEFAPKSDSEEPNTLSVESLVKLEVYEHYCDIFTSGSKEERNDFTTLCEKAN